MAAPKEIAGIVENLIVTTIQIVKVSVYNSHSF